MEQELYLELTGNSDIIRIEPLSWAHPNAELDWDKNWIHSKITVKGGAFHGQFNCYLMTIDFELFKRDMKMVYQNLSGKAEFKTLESQIEINIQGDGLGHFEINCTLADEPGTGNKLIIKMHFDQTYIPEVIQQLDNIIKTYPIQGTELNIRNEVV